MNILMIHNYYQQRGGEDAVFESESALLKEHGHTVDTLTFHNDAISTPLEKIKTGLSLVHNTHSAQQLKEKINARRPNVIHIHNFFPLGSPALLSVAQEFSIPVVMTLHNYRLICPKALLYRDGHICEDCVHDTFPLTGIFRGCYRDSISQTAALGWMTAVHKKRGTWRNQVAGYIALTEFAKNRFLDSSLHLNPAQVSVKPNFVFDSGDGQAEREPFVLFIGRLSAEKGITPLLEAFKTSEHRLKIIGGGPEEPVVRQAAESHPNIEYLGFQDKAFILNELKKSAGLVFPSIWYEGFPMTLAEALSTGTPAIVSTIGGLPEIVENGYNGLHSPPGDAQGIHTQVNTLLSDPALQKTLGKNARTRYLERYTPDTNYQQLIEIYTRVIELEKVKSHG